MTARQALWVGLAITALWNSAARAEPPRRITLLKGAVLRGADQHPGDVAWIFGPFESSRWEPSVSQTARSREWKG